jgi:hypothetical protein
MATTVDSVGAHSDVTLLPPGESYDADEASPGIVLRNQEDQAPIEFPSTAEAVEPKPLDITANFFG